ncbi:MAG: hypothetical protein JXJ18_03395 [Rhodobacteraceae bacterium]|nr:hypothetical protein [Paracoccaceae bacterium]
MKSNISTSRALWLRIVLAIPVIGWVVRDLLEGDKDSIWYLLGGLGCLWVIAIMTWGVPALYLPAVAAVPFMLIVILLISRG